MPAKRGFFALQPRPPSGQYSIQKFLELHAYIARASRWRVVYVIVSTPLPALVAALLPSCLPLRPLRDGASLAFYVQVFVNVVFITGGAVMPTLLVTGVPTSVYSHREVVLVSLCCGGVHVALTAALIRLWRFPIPFYMVVAVSLLFVSVSLAHLVVLRRKCWREPSLTRAVRLYGIGLLLQVLQVAVYPAISVLFDYVSGIYQISITLLFPLVKITIKYLLRRTTRSLRDQHGVVVVAAVEICSSLYQSMIMQSVPSVVAMIVIMVLDFVQGFTSIKLFLDRPCAVPKHLLVAEALNAVRVHQVTSAIMKSKTSTTRSASVVVPAAGPPVIASRPKGPTTQDIIRRARTESRVTTRRRLVRQALQLTQVAETILLMEYFEVIIPLVNCVFVAVAAQLRSAFFNTKLREFYGHPTRLHRAMASILLYALLQGLSYVAMHLIMKHRYGLSATYHLAFVLEHHRVGIQGKMVAWLPVIFHFTSVHYGTDFSFRFDFDKWEQW